MSEIIVPTSWGDDHEPIEKPVEEVLEEIDRKTKADWITPMAESPLRTVYPGKIHDTMPVILDGTVRKLKAWVEGEWVDGTFIKECSTVTLLTVKRRMRAGWSPREAIFTGPCRSKATKARAVMNSRVYEFARRIAHTLQAEAAKSLELRGSALHIVMNHALVGATAVKTAEEWLGVFSDLNGAEVYEAIDRVAAYCDDSRVHNLIYAFDLYIKGTLTPQSFRRDVARCLPPREWVPMTYADEEQMDGGRLPRSAGFKKADDGTPMKGLFDGRPLDWWTLEEETSTSICAPRVDLTPIVRVMREVLRGRRV